MPFTLPQFLDVFAAFNRATWPAVVILWLLTALATAAIVQRKGSSTAVVGLAAVHWLWVGIAYHAIFFSRINPAAWFFAALSIVQAFLLDRLALARPTPVWADGPRRIVGLAFLFYGLLYPMLILATGHAAPAAPLFGVPCPTALWTTGVLLTMAPPVPRVVFIVPIAWSLVGGSAAVIFGMTPDVALFASAVALVGALVHQRSLLATREERRRLMPGDALITVPGGSITHAVTLAARPADVWPWLVQMGAGRGGWYSYDRLDNGGHASATEIVPALQQIHVGAIMPALPGHVDAFTVMAVEPSHSLVLGALQPNGQCLTTWAFELHNLGASTRLVVRVRGRQDYRLWRLPVWATTYAIRVVHFIMERRQLLGLARRVERG